MRRIGACLLWAAVLSLEPASVYASSKRVLCSTFPIYQITRNVAQGRDGVDVSLMLPARLGCPHDYVLTPEDMRKLAQADILIVNGLGLEEFLGARVKSANSRVVVLDSSAGINGTLEYPPESVRDEARNHGVERRHHRSGVNPHLFSSPRMVARLAMNIAAELSKSDPDGARIYLKNADAYAGKMNTLADEFAEAGKSLRNNRIVTQHGVFDYFARDMGLEVVAVLQPHAGQEPSAAEMLEIVKVIKAKQAGAVFSEPQYPSAIGQTIARETGIPVATLDPVASGPSDAGLDYYENVMRRNMAIIKKILGTR